MDFKQKHLTSTDSTEFHGVVVAKLSGAEFTVKLTKFPNKEPIPAGTEVLVKAKLSGRLIAKTSRARVGVYDNVVIAISYEGAKSKIGTIVRREKRLPLAAIVRN